MHAAPPVVVASLGYVYWHEDENASEPVVPDITDAWEVFFKACLVTGACGQLNEGSA